MIGAGKEAQALLDHQLKPALVLDTTGIVIAINAGGLRLICSSPTTVSHNSSSIKGNNISNLGIFISPTRWPSLWTWDQILVATAAAANACIVANGHNEQQPSAPSFSGDVSQVTNDFWDLEADKQASIESDVYLTKHAPGATPVRGAQDEDSLFKIKARANVCWCPPGIFLVVFDRPSMSPSLVGTASQAARYPPYVDDISILPTYCSPDMFPVSSFGNPVSSQDHTPTAAQVTSSLIPYIMATLNEEGQVVQFSDSWYRFSGLSKEESLGSGWISAIHPHDVLKMTTAWAEVLQQKRGNWTHEARYLEASSGNYYWFMIRAQLYKDASGKSTCWYASMMDVNDGVKARREADRRCQSMLTLISRTDVLLWGVNQSMELYIREGGLDWNPPSVSESPADQTIAQSDQDSEASYRNKHEKLGPVVRTILLGHEFTPVVEHTEVDRHFRTIFVAERATSAISPGGTSMIEAALALTIEVTDQVMQSKLRMENETLALNERAASEASVLKGRFLANMSHEIRTPISGIIGFSELLCGSLTGKEQLDLVGDIRTSAQFLLTLVNDILDLSKIDVGQLSLECIPFALCDAIRETLVPLQLQAKEKGVGLGWTCDTSIIEATFLGDPHRLRQILTNLIGNSIKFTMTGSVHLHVHVVKNESCNLSNIQFKVQDSGIGIAEKARDFLFKPFSQADSSTARMYGGTGLGLSICRELIGMMGGVMSLQSTLGKGTTVTFNVKFKLGVLPPIPDRTRLADVPQPPTIKKVPEREPLHTKRPIFGNTEPSTSKILILVVDDNIINRKINSQLILKLGYDVVTACNGQEALDYLCLGSKKPQPDMVFMDCMMPVIDGYEATRRIRDDKDMFSERTRKLPIVALTASVVQSDKDRCWEVGMDDYLSRPVSQQALKNSVLKWASRKKG